jgi:hypothetical protein
MSREEIRRFVERQVSAHPADDVSLGSTAGARRKRSAKSAAPKRKRAAGASVAGAYVAGCEECGGCDHCMGAARPKRCAKGYRKACAKAGASVAGSTVAGSTVAGRRKKAPVKKAMGAARPKKCPKGYRKSCAKAGAYVAGKRKVSAKAKAALAGWRDAVWRVVDEYNGQYSYRDVLRIPKLLQEARDLYYA